MLSVHLSSHSNISLNEFTDSTSQYSLKDRICSDWKKNTFIASSVLILIGIALTFFFNLPYLMLLLSQVGLVNTIVYHSCCANSNTDSFIQDKIENKTKKKSIEILKNQNAESPSTPIPANLSEEEPDKSLQRTSWYEQDEERHEEAIQTKYGMHTMKKKVVPEIKSGIQQMRWTQQSHQPKSDTEEVDSKLERSESFASDDEEESDLGAPTADFKQQLDQFYLSPKEERKPK